MVKKKINYDETDPRDIRLLSLLDNAGRRQGELCKSALLFVSNLYGLDNMDSASIKKFADFLKSATASGVVTAPSVSTPVTSAPVQNEEKVSEISITEESSAQNETNLAESIVSVGEIMGDDDEFTIDATQEKKMAQVLSAFGVG